MFIILEAVSELVFYELEWFSWARFTVFCI